MKAALLAHVQRNPYPLYAVLRRVRPVLHVPRPGVWMLFDYPGVRRALTDHEAFSSRAAPPGGSPLDWMIFQDPPRHTKLRGIISRAFTPRAIADLEPRVHALVHRLIDSAVQRPVLDLVRDVSAPLPLSVITALLGIPSDDAERLTRWTGAILGLSGMVAGGAVAARAAASYAAATAEMRPYLAAQVAERRVAPRDDLLSRLTAAEVEGEKLDEQEIFDFFQLLLLAGSETTTNLISNAILCLLDHPGQLALVRAERERVPAVLEEVLRFRAPVQFVFRSTRHPVQVRGITIPEGALVLPMIGSANRDPRQFVNAHRFDIARVPLRHDAFGHGIHFCLGAALARLEARVALNALLDRLEDIRLVHGRRWDPQPGLNVHGPRSLDIGFRAA